MAYKRSIVLIGFSGSGKTRAGYLLAKNIGFCFLDTDLEIEKLTGASVSDIFHVHGEEFFRQAERKVMNGLPASGCVVALGGSAVLNAAEMETVKRNGLVVYLAAGAEKIRANLSGDTTRPLLDKPDKYEAVIRLLAIRAPLYEQYADVRIDTDHLDIPETVREIEKKWRSA